MKVECAVDKSFAAQVVYVVDAKIQRWLGECKTVRDRSEVNDEIVDFNIIANDILDNRFTVCLPLAFKHTDNVETNLSVLGAPSGDQKGKKKSRGNENTERPERIWNSDQQEEFKMKENKDWKMFFGNKVQDRIDWNDDGYKMCPRWHSKGFFFENCHNKASHVPKDNIPLGKVKYYKAYLAKVRKN